MCLGVILGAHGVRGALRVRSFTEVPEDVAAYGPVSDESGERIFALEVIGASAGAVLARIEGIADRDAAEALKGVRLYVGRDALPPPAEDEYYHGDLLGLAAVLADGTPLGTVSAVRAIGATDALEIERGGGRQSVVVPFTRDVVPEVDIAGGRVVVDPPTGLIEDGDGEAER